MTCTLDSCTPLPLGASCGGDYACDSEICDAGRCACELNGSEPPQSANQCCSSWLSDEGACCNRDGSCQDDADCCNGVCRDAGCQSLSVGTKCTADVQCGHEYCDGGVCACIQRGGVATTEVQCCSGVANLSPQNGEQLICT